MTKKNLIQKSGNEIGTLVLTDGMDPHPYWIALAAHTIKKAI